MENLRWLNTITEDDLTESGLRSALSSLSIIHLLTQILLQILEATLRYTSAFGGVPSTTLTIVRGPYSTS